MTQEEKDVIAVVVSTLEDRLWMIKSSAALQEIQIQLSFLFNRKQEQLNRAVSKGSKLDELTRLTEDLGGYREIK